MRLRELRSLAQGHTASVVQELLKVQRVPQGRARGRPNGYSQHRDSGPEVN